MGERRGVYRVLVGKPEGKITLGRPMCRWEGNIKVDLQELEFEGVWTPSAICWHYKELTIFSTLAG